MRCERLKAHTGQENVIKFNVSDNVSLNRKCKSSIENEVGGGCFIYIPGPRAAKKGSSD